MFELSDLFICFIVGIAGGLCASLFADEFRVQYWKARCKELEAMDEYKPPRGKWLNK